MSGETMINHFFPKWQQLRTALALDGGWVLRSNLKEIKKKKNNVLFIYF